MGATASRHFADIVANVETVVAVEALCAAQACDLRSLTPSGTLGESYRLVRSKVGTLERDDRIIADDVAAMTTLIRGGDLAALIDVEDEAS
jgi:histidine ammonia-lyase